MRFVGLLRSLQASWLTSGRKCRNAVINIGLVRLPLWEWDPKLAVGQRNNSFKKIPAECLVG